MTTTRCYLCGEDAETAGRLCRMCAMCVGAVAAQEVAAEMRRPPADRSAEAGSHFWVGLTDDDAALFGVFCRATNHLFVARRTSGEAILIVALFGRAFCWHCAERAAQPPAAEESLDR